MGEGSGNGQVVARGEQREVFGLLLVPGAGMLLPRTPKLYSVFPLPCNAVKIRRRRSRGPHRSSHEADPVV
jgi:hypothetical protein